MIIYFADKQINIISVASSTTKQGLILANDAKVEDVDTGAVTFEFDLYFTEKNREKAMNSAVAGNYILKKNKDGYEFYTIIDSEYDTQTMCINVYAEDEGLDLLNEVTDDSYAQNAESHPIADYVNTLIYDTGFEIGLDELGSTRTRTLQWEAGNTATAQLDTVANAFEAEISFSFNIDGLMVKKKIINIHKKRGNTDVATLRLDKQLNNIKVKKSIANLATCYRVTGGIPEGAENPVTLVGYKYDDGDFYVSESGWLMSRNALSKWSRYQWEQGLSNDVGHIVKNFTSSLTTQQDLFNSALSSLKKVCDTQVEYEVDIAILPDNVRVGDTINIVDERHRLYINARVLKLETKEIEGTSTATLGNYKLTDYDVSQKIQNLSDEFVKLASKRQLYTWIAYADDDKGSGISLDPTGKQYLGICANQFTKQNKESIKNPSIYRWAKIEGKTGKGVATHVTQYYLSTSDTECSNGSWSEKQQDWVKGCYYWTREYTTWTDGSSSTSEPILEEGLNNAINTAKDVENDVVNFKNLTAEKFTAINGQFNGIDTDIVNINKSLSAQEASIKKLDAEKLSANEAELSYAKIDALETVSGKFNTLESDYGKFKELTTTNITGITADIKQIKTDNVDIAGRVTANEGSIKNLNTDKLSSADAYLVFAKISDLNATNANITNMNANLAKISTLLSGSVTAGSTETIVLNAKNTTIENALIKDAMIDSLSFNKLKGIDINTTKLSVHSNDGKSTWKDNTIKITDSSRTRVQIGKDSEGDYNIYIWDKAGNLMFDPLGLTDKGVTREVIDNSNVKENAGIAGSKLDIDSVITSINGSTTTIKSSQIKFDDKNQTLDIVFKSMETSLSNQEKTITTIQNDVKSTNDIASSALSSAKNANTDASNALSQIKTVEEKVTSNTTAINTANGKINTLITDVTQSKTDITTVKGDISTTKANVATLQNVYSSLTQTVNSLNSTLGSHSSTIATIQNNLKNTTDKIDNLQVGGRNLLKGSHATDKTYTYPSSSYSDVWFKRSTVELNGDTYTLSFWAKSSVAGDRIYAYFYSPNTVTSSITSQGNTYNSPDGSCIFTLSTVMTKYWVTFKMPKNSGSSKTIILPRLIAGVGSGTVSVKWEKLEEGNKVTDWTPAPEDTQTQITTISDKQSTFEQTLSGLSNTVSSLESTVKTKADNSTVSSLSTTVNTLKSDLSGFKTSVSQTYATKTELNTANSNITSLTSRVQTAEQKLTKDGITNIVSDYYTKKTDFDSLQVGGRNILRESGYWDSLPSDYWISNGGGIELDTSTQYLGHSTIKTTVGAGIRAKINYELDTNKTYTYSALVKADKPIKTNNTHIPLHYQIYRNSNGTDGGAFIANSYQQVIEKADNWTLLYITFKPSAKYFKPFIWAGQYISPAATMNIAYFKLEEGNKPTDWTPAPEDINTSISSVKTVADQTATKFSWLVKSGTSATDFQLTDRTATLVASQINLNGLVSFGGLNSDAQSKINNASSNASTALSTANTAKSTASTAKSTADTAKSTADSAKSTASSALTTANSASSTASTANSNASSALTTANSAKSLADTLNGNTLKRHQITVSLASSSYDVSKYYPVLLNAGIPTNGTYTYEVNVQLNSGTKPSWATHSAGFTCNLKANVKANGWGATNGYGWIEDNYYSFCDKMPAYITQFRYSSKIVFYLRGGGTYYIYSPQVNDSATIYTAKTNLYDSTYPYYVEPTTSPSNGFDIVQPATIGSWCAANDKTFINGAKIYTGSITALQIASGTITADKIASKTITTDKLNVSSLSAISANLGTVTAGSISINGKFSVTSSGVLTATSGTIGGWKIEDTKISSSDGGMSVWNEMSLTSDASLSSVQYNKADSMQYRTKLYAGMIDIGYQAYGDTNNTSLERGINISGGLLNFYNASTNSVGAIEVDNSGPSLKISASNSLEVIAKAYTFKINNKQVYMFGLQSTYDF